jgi:serine protease Do
MKIKHPIRTLFALAIATLLVAQAYSKDEFSEEKFRDLLMKEAQENNGELQLDLDKLKDLMKRSGMSKGDLQELGLEELMKFFSQGGEGFNIMPGMMSLAEEDIDRLEKQYIDLVEGHKPSAQKAAKSTVAFLKDGKLVVMGTIVDANGLVVTKASEFKKVRSGIECDTGDGKLVDAKLIKEFKEHDLALIKIQKKNLTPITWYVGDFPEMGAFLIAPAPANEEPLAIGVLSVPARSLSQKDRAFLGVGLEKVDDGIRVTQVLPLTSAAKSGVEVGDIFTKLDGVATDTVQDFINTVSSKKPGEHIALAALRAEEKQTFDIKLGTRPEMGQQRADRFERMNQMGSRLSDSRMGYPSAFQHDLPLEPEFCGGPVVDLDGRVLGLNIARAGRVKTYAIPGETIELLLGDIDPEVVRGPAEVAPPTTNAAITDSEQERLEEQVKEARTTLATARKQEKLAEDNLKRLENKLQALQK